MSITEEKVIKLKAKRDEWLKTHQFRAFHKHEYQTKSKPDVIGGRHIIGAVCGCGKKWTLDLK